ncbi:hypothetical protein CSHISOI_09930 [Colletotrichum shisoi]|uniref:Uncharacterized protein n=1 Tax=Colletotrichum shisoi TaxID=2078593 RepID=A0A5Q4BEZ0_9PEZI|nr:hypothetical protein CSHISOI_09930 [Colletotrichum shisoi]
MQFATILATLLPALDTTKTVTSFDLCLGDFRAACLPSSDGIRRCFQDGEFGDTCVVDCRSQSSCFDQCASQGFANGFCTIDGSAPCLCSHLDGGSDAI